MDIALAITAIPWMFCGLFACLFYTEKIGREDFVLGLVCSLAAFFLAPCRWFITFNNVLPSYALAATLFGTLLWNKGHSKWLNSRLMKFLGGISYPFYAIHTAVAILVVAYAPSPYKLAAFIGLALITSWCLHHAIELPFMKFGKKLETRVFSRAAS